MDPETAGTVIGPDPRCIFPCPSHPSIIWSADECGAGTEWPTKGKCVVSFLVYWASAGS